MGIRFGFHPSRRKGRSYNLNFVDQVAAETSGSARVRLSHPLLSGPQPSDGSFFGLRRAPQPENARV